MTLSKQQLQDACNGMTKMVPQPMNSMLDKQPREEAYNSCSPHSTIWYVFWNLKQYCLKSKVVDWWRVNLVRLINSLEGRLGDQSPYFLANNLSPGVFSGVVVWLSALVESSGGLVFVCWCLDNLCRSKSFQVPLHKQRIMIKWGFALSEKEIFHSTIYPYLNTFFIALPNQTSGEQRERPARARPVCSLCKKPMRGHSAVLDCPRNNKE